ncbi:MAG: 8-oxoguanine glycosylase ogg1 [Candelina mexicana]|nr:MAG: 8-oxoguanine glycosylase ogg1 [Candelina mexicana]
MSQVQITGWKKLPISLRELCIDTTLRCGQSFRSCALHGRIISLRQDTTHLHYRAIFPIVQEAPPTPPSSTAETDALEDNTVELLQHYFNLTPCLADLYEQWSAADANFKKKAPKFTGVRILRQDAWEALVGFICSSNNNIARISQMVEKLCIHYGPLIGYIDSQPYYDFPQPSVLTDPKVEGHLRQLGFGYRAKYLHQTAMMVVGERNPNWLEDLRNPESPGLGGKPNFAGEMKPGGRDGYRDAHEKLLSLQGVGPKVADCVCLMGLGWGEAVPVDTHVWQIAQRDYKFGKGKHKSLTKATYDAIGNQFRNLWGKEAGWAHSVLFTADLRAFSEKLDAKVEPVEALMTGKVEDEMVLETKTDLTTELIAKSVKREWEDDEKKVLEFHETARSKRAKRRQEI